MRLGSTTAGRQPGDGWPQWHGGAVTPVIDRPWFDGSRQLRGSDVDSHLVGEETQSGQLSDAGLRPFLVPLRRVGRGDVGLGNGATSAAV
jgi:hypothetical protein